MLHKSCAKSLLLFFRLPPGYPRKKAARFFMPDGFLRNVIVLIYFLVFSSKTFRFRVNKKS